MQLEWLQYFLETCRSKSLSKASENLNITQPALSKLIRNLERELDVTLFHRTVTGMELTVAGIQLQERVKPILDDIHVLFNDLKYLDDYKQVTIGVLPSIAAYYLPSRMSSIQESFPDTQLVVGNTSEDVLQLLTTGQVQAVIAERRTSHRHLWQSLLFEEPYYCVVHETSRFAEANAISVLEIVNEPLVLYPSNCDIRTCIVQNYARRGVIPNVSLDIPFSESIFAFVGAGAGITIAPESISNQADRYGLRAVKIDDFGDTRKIVVLSRSEAIGKLLHRRLTKNDQTATLAPSQSNPPLD